MAAANFANVPLHSGSMIYSKMVVVMCVTASTRAQEKPAAVIALFKFSSKGSCFTPETTMETRLVARAFVLLAHLSSLNVDLLLRLPGLEFVFGFR